jgi:hypothetical protein
VPAGGFFHCKAGDVFLPVQPKPLNTNVSVSSESGFMLGLDNSKSAALANILDAITLKANNDFFSIQTP